jgi:type I restriction enzyme S subunit
LKSNYKKLGPHIQEVNLRNSDLEIDTLLGVSVKKIFIPSIANTVGTNFKKYKIVRRSQFTYIADTSRRGDKIGLAFLKSHDSALVSQAYTVFEIIDHNKLSPEYLMMWFMRPEFNRYSRYKSHGSVREIFNWEEMCDVELPIPSIEKQQEIVNEYNTITNRITLNEKLNQKLEETARYAFNHRFQWNGDEKWEDTRLGDIIEIRGGFSYHSSNIGKGSAYLLGMGCISFNDRFLEDGMRLYSDDFPDKHLVKPRDIVIATRQQSENMPILGYPAMIPSDLEEEKLIIASNLYRVTNRSDISNEILYQLFRSSDYIERIRLNTKGTTVGMITKDAIEDYYFKLPPSDVIEKLHLELKALVDFIFVKRKEIKSLIEMRALLLSKMIKV